MLITSSTRRSLAARAFVWDLSLAWTSRRPRLRPSEAAFSPAPRCLTSCDDCSRYAVGGLPERLMHDGWNAPDAAVDEQLRLSQERLRSVLDRAPIILYAVDKDGHVTLAEGSALTQLGLTRDHVLG